MRVGLTFSNAPIIICGEGKRVRKCTWHPLATDNNISKAKPYMCAIGSILTIPSPGLTNEILSIANLVLDHKLR